MELQFTVHAARRMSEQSTTRQDVETVISTADTVTCGETAIEYDATVKVARCTSSWWAMPIHHW